MWTAARRWFYRWFIKILRCKKREGKQSFWDSLRFGEFQVHRSSQEAQPCSLSIFCFSNCLSSDPARQKREREKRREWTKSDRQAKRATRLTYKHVPYSYYNSLSGIEIRKFMRSMRRESGRKRCVLKLKRWWCIINAAVRVQTCQFNPFYPASQVGTDS